MEIIIQYLIKQPGTGSDAGLTYDKKSCCWCKILLYNMKVIMYGKKYRSHLWSKESPLMQNIVIQHWGYNTLCNKTTPDWEWCKSDLCSKNLTSMQNHVILHEDYNTASTKAAHLRGLMQVSPMIQRKF